MSPNAERHLLIIVATFALAAVPSAISVTVAGTASPTDCQIPAAGSVDLSVRDLAGTARLLVQPPSTKRVTLDVLNVSGNPNLEQVRVPGALQVMQINTLDLTGTAVMPTSQLIHFDRSQSVLLSVRHVFINWTTVERTTLQFAAFTDLLYRLRAQSFVVSNWTVAGFDANFSQADNACQSKKFDSVTLRDAGLTRIDNAVVSATRCLNFSSNRIHRVANVTFHSGSVDLSGNRIASLSNVSFQPGTFCRTLITGPSEVRLAGNLITIDALQAAGEQPMLRGLDLSRNPLLVRSPGQRPVRRRIRIVEWLRLESVLPVGGLGRDEVTQRLGELLGHFEPASQPISVDLSGNGFLTLAGVSRALAMAGFGPQDQRLRMAGCCSSADHLNLSELTGRAPWLDLGDLANGRVRSVSGVVRLNVLERWAAGRGPDFDALQVELQANISLTPRPGACCTAQGTGQLFCFLRPQRDVEYRRLVCGSRVGPGRPDVGNQPTTSPALVALILVVAVLAVVAGIVATLCVCRLRRRQRRRPVLARYGAAAAEEAKPAVTAPLTNSLGGVA